MVGVKAFRTVVCLRIAVEVRASGLLYVLGLWLGLWPQDCCMSKDYGWG